MGREAGLVRFSDGEVRYLAWDNTGDAACYRLFDSYESVEVPLHQWYSDWASARELLYTRPQDDEQAPVEDATAWVSVGLTWPIRATRQWIVEGSYPEGLGIILDWDKDVDWVKPYLNMYGQVYKPQYTQQGSIDDNNITEVGNGK